jgi:hypothetical protein
MTITLKSGPATVLTSGSATCFMGHPLTLQLDDPLDLTVQFAFRTDPAVEDVAVEVTTEPNAMTLLCTNFDAPDGRGSAQPVLVGELEHRLVFLHFRVFRYGRTEDRTVHFTLYEVEKSAVNWQPQG